MLGKTLGGRYQIVRHLGGGGFGQTYLAEDLHLPGQPLCVVKQFKPRLDDLRALQAARRLFDLEAQALYILGNHDQIPQLFAHFEEVEAGGFFLVQEFIEGTILSQELREKKRFNESDVVSLLQDVLQVLEFVHGQNVVHRDLKPSNLIRRQRDHRIVLIDFGAVKQIGAPLAHSINHPETMTIAIGSSGYMPNEQIAGKPRFSSDIYALGMLAIQCLTGICPKKLREDPVTSEIIWRDQVQVSSELADLIDRMVRYDFRQRFPSAKEALVALHALTAVETTPTTPAQRPTVADEVYLAWLERGDELFQQQRHREAIAAYDRVIQAKPDEYLAWFKRGICLENLSRFEEAAAAYLEVVQLHPEDYLAWYRRGNVLERLQQLSEALVAYDQVIAIQPENYWAWQDRGKVLEGLRQVDAALAAYERAVQLKPDFQLAIESRKRVLSQLHRVDDLFHLQHYDETLESCDRAIQQNPQDSLAWLMRGMALDNLQRYEDALSAYDQVVAIQPEDQVAWFKRGNTLEKLHRYEDAIASYYRVVQLQPDNHWAWHDRGRLLEQLRRLEEAMAAYDRAIQVKPDFQPAQEGRRRVLHQLQNPIPQDNLASSEIDAVKQPTQLTQLLEQPTMATLLENDTIGVEATTISPVEARHHFAAERVDEETILSALPSFATAETGETVREERPRDYTYWLNYGQSMGRLQRYSDALAAYEQAQQLNANDAALWQAKGDALAGLGRHAKAQEAYLRATQLNPQEGAYWFCLGVCLTRLKHYPEAIAAFEQATRCQTSHYLSWYWQGRVRCELKQYTEALQCFNQALVSKPDYQPAIKARDVLQRCKSLPSLPLATTSGAS